MIYRPIASRSLWDTWLFEWENQYHLFFLETQQTHNDHVGHAVSRDLVHWETLPSIYTTGQPDEWNHKRTATGMVVRHNNMFYMFVGGYDPKVQAGESQVVGLYISRDLYNWEPYSGNPVMFPDFPYLVDPANGFFNIADWRDPYIVWREDDKHYHAFLCARMPEWDQSNMGSAVAHIRSKDLINWESLPPAAVVKQYPNMEVPEIFELDGRYYLTFSTNSLTGLRINTPSREDIRGTMYMIGSSFDGPFALPGDPLLIGSGHKKMGAYVGRSISYQGGRLLYHQVGDSNVTRPAFGTPKMIRSNEDGSLWLEYLPALEKLETRVLIDSFMNVPTHVIRDFGRWVKNENSLIGSNDTAGSSYRIAEDISDLHIQCRISATSACCAGIMLKISEENKGVAVILDFENQRLQIGTAEIPGIYNSALALFGWNCNIHDSQKFSLNRKQVYHLRCFARAEFFEVYLDNSWIFTACLPSSPQTGNIECYIERGKAEFMDMRLAQIEPL